MVNQLSDKDSRPEHHREPKDLSFTRPPVRPIAAGDPRCNNGLWRKNSSPSRGNNSAPPGV